MFVSYGMLIFPLLITTLILGLHARWAWMRTMDKILDGMKLDDVRQRVEKAEWHRNWAKKHAIALAIGLAITALTYMIAANNVGDNQVLSFLTIGSFIWIYGLFIPHLLALYLYHVRWNPKTIVRKQKLDAENAIYEGNYDLDPNAQYGVNEEGELVNLAELEDEQGQYMQAK